MSIQKSFMESVSFAKTYLTEVFSDLFKPEDNINIVSKSIASKAQQHKAVTFPVAEYNK